MGGRSRTSNAQSSTTDVQNLNLQDIDGFALANSSGNTFTLTDQGSLDLARDVSQRALSTAVDIGGDALLLGREGLREGADLAVQGLDNALEATRGSLAFGESALASNERTADAALGFGRASLDSVTDIAGEGFSFARLIFDAAIDAQDRLVETNLTGLNDLAGQASASADDRVSKVAIYAFAAIAAAMVLPKVLGKGAA